MKKDTGISETEIINFIENALILLDLIMDVEIYVNEVLTLSKIYNRRTVLKHGYVQASRRFRFPPTRKSGPESSSVAGGDPRLKELMRTVR